MKKQAKRLEIKTTTVRALSEMDARSVAGGAPKLSQDTDCACISKGESCTGPSTCWSVFASHCTMCP